MSCFTNCVPEFKSFLSTYANTTIENLFKIKDENVLDMAESLWSSYSDIHKDAIGMRPRDLSMTVADVVASTDRCQEMLNKEWEEEQKVIEGITIDGKPIVKGEWVDPFVYDPIN